MLLATELPLLLCMFRPRQEEETARPPMLEPHRPAVLMTHVLTTWGTPPATSDGEVTTTTAAAAAAAAAVAAGPASSGILTPPPPQLSALRSPPSQLPAQPRMRMMTTTTAAGQAVTAATGYAEAVGAQRRQQRESTVELERLAAEVSVGAIQTGRFCIYIYYIR